MIKKSCPHCAKPIGVRLEWYDDAFEDPHVEFERVQVWEPCSTVSVPFFMYGAGLSVRAHTASGEDGDQPCCDAGDRRRSGHVCNWLGPTCNIASHVTRCRPRGRIGTLHNPALDPVGWARCVQGSSA